MRHLQRGDGDAARVGRLGGPEEDARLLEQFHGLGRTGHVGALGDGDAAVMQQRTRGSGVQLILRGAGQGDLAGDLPDAAAAFSVDGVRTQSGIFADALALDLLQALHEGNVDAVGIVDVPGGVGHGHDLCAKLLGLFAGVECDVA